MPVMTAQSKAIRSMALPIAGFLLVSFLFCFPLLKDLYSSCRGDWDYFFALYEAPAISLFEYRQFPLWNPYGGGGMPILANPQAGFLSPIALTTAFFGVVAGLKLSVWLHTFIGLWGMWLLAGRMGIAAPARLASAFIFMFSGAWVYHLAEGHMTWLPAAFLPLVMLAWLNAAESRRWLAAAAVLLSMMIYEGGTYVFAYSVLFLCAYAAAQSLSTRSPAPAVTAAAIIVLAALLAAPKLLPMLELMSSHPRTVGPGSAVSWGDFIGSLIERNNKMGSNTCESASYVGVPVFILFLGSLVAVRGQFPLITASLFMLLVSIGNFAWFSPWGLLHRLPLFRSFQAPTRALIVVCFAMALLVGLFLTWIMRQDTWWATCFVSLLVLVIGADLASYNSTVFLESTTPLQVSIFRLTGPMQLDKPAELYHVPPGQSARLGHSVAYLQRPFSQVRVPDLERFRHGGWSNQYLPLLHNQGVVDAYETIPIPSFAQAVTDRGYGGEFRLLGAGEAELVKWSPNGLSFHVSAPETTSMVINQNYWAGWQATRGVVRNHGGLLAIELPAGSYDFSVQYRPDSFQYGLAMCAVALLLVVFALFDRKKRLRTAGSA